MKISSKIKTAIVAASALSILAIAAPASAGVVTFQTSGQWSNVVGGSNVDFDPGAGAGDVKLSWGSTWYDHDESSYLFDAKNPAGFNLSDGQTSSGFTLGEFVHDNEAIAGSGILSANLLVNTKIFVDGQYVTTQSYTWNFKHNETPNFCWGNGCSSDIVKVGYSGDYGDSFQVGNDLYTLTLGGFNAKQGNTYTPQDTFITKEDKSTTAYLRGQLSMTTLTSAVPEPATWAMMLVGFFGAGSMLRTTRRKELMATAA